MGHIVLLGDSIFDNARYVPGNPSLVEQARKFLLHGWRATLLAVDGHVTEDVSRQLARLPVDATHLFVSAGGNDALGESSLLNEPACTVGEALLILHEMRTRFRDAYREMLRNLAAASRPTVLCTIYDAIPGLGEAERTALASFNEIILRLAFAAGLPVIDLRLVCGERTDYSHISPIEPSATGGAKIARLIAEAATTHEFEMRRSVIYSH
jgi:lysophospholipase L1-like esterase